MLSIRSGKEHLTFKVHLQPKSSRNAIAGLHGDALKITVTAAPVGGAANAMCCRYLARRLGVPKHAVEIVAGSTSRSKRLRIHCSAEEKAGLRKSIQDFATAE